MIPVKTLVLYRTHSFSRGITAEVIEYVEGWYKLRFADMSVAIVPPSKVTEI